jgi:hypothetical protein
MLRSERPSDGRSAPTSASLLPRFPLRLAAMMPALTAEPALPAAFLGVPFPLLSKPLPDAALSASCSPSSHHASYNTIGVTACFNAPKHDMSIISCVFA